MSSVVTDPLHGMESRINYSDMTNNYNMRAGYGTTGMSPNYNMMDYRTMMNQGGTRLGVSRGRQFGNSWGLANQGINGAGQNNLNRRIGAGEDEADTSIYGSYLNYDYGTTGGSGVRRSNGLTSGAGFGLTGLGAKTSGYGGGSSGYSPISVVSNYGPGACEDEGLNPALVLATLAGAAVAFYLIYTKLTGITGRKIQTDNIVPYIASLVLAGKYMSQ